LRYNFSSRNVIRQDPQLRIDEIKLPYKALVIMLKPQIENVLHRMYGISFQEAYNIWYKAQANVDQTVVKIIELLIKNGPKDPDTGIPQGLPMIINRIPSIVSLKSVIRIYRPTYIYI
jgi:DNA-directed RNA polymerase beta' subunit